MKLLNEEGVIAPEVDLQYLDASISGLVETDAKAQSIGRKVESIRGVRLVENGLIARGFLEVKRLNGQLTATGSLPLNWREEVFKEQSEIDTSGLKASNTTTIEGIRAVSLGLVIDSVFEKDGNRSLKIQGNLLSLNGESTPQEGARYEKLVKSLGQKVELDSSLTLYPSSYHFESREISSPIEGESQRSLSQQLTDKTVKFSAGTSSLTTESREKLQEIALLLQRAELGVEFVLGCHPDQAGAELARNRAKTAHQFLVESGMNSDRVEVVTFEMTEEESEFLGQVELLVR